MYMKSMYRRFMTSLPLCTKVLGHGTAHGHLHKVKIPAIPDVTAWMYDKACHMMSHGKAHVHDHGALLYHNCLNWQQGMGQIQKSLAISPTLARQRHEAMFHGINAPSIVGCDCLIAPPSRSVPVPALYPYPSPPLSFPGLAMHHISCPSPPRHIFYTPQYP